MEEAFAELPRAVFLRCGGDLLTLAKTKSRPRETSVHFGFQARDRADFEAWKRWLPSNHIRIARERAEQTVEGFYFKDPDRYTIEIFYEA